jgi:hypothetical protein
LDFLRELHAKKVDLFLHQQGLDTSTGVFAQFERAMIRERVLAGLARAARTINTRAPAVAAACRRLSISARMRPFVVTGRPPAPSPDAGDPQRQSREIVAPLQGIPR